MTAQQRRKSAKKARSQPFIDVIRVPLAVDAIEYAVREELGPRADALIEKYNMQPPIHCALLDGHGHQILVFDVNWDANGNLIESHEGQWSGPPIAAGLFLAMKDADGVTATVKLEIEDHSTTQ